jgi:hypothetical protein
MLVLFPLLLEAGDVVAGPIDRGIIIGKEAAKRIPGIIPDHAPLSSSVLDNAPLPSGILDYAPMPSGSFPKPKSEYCKLTACGPIIDRGKSGPTNGGTLPSLTGSALGSAAGVEGRAAED